jgi:hypothetical protein
MKATDNTGLLDNMKDGLEESREKQLFSKQYFSEQHFSHEAWHVSQQMDGRVKPTTETAGMPVNHDENLEHEADVMGAKANETCIKE